MGGQGRIEVVCDGAGSLQLPVEQRAADPLPTARGSDPSPAGDAVLLGLADLGLEPAEGHQLVTVPHEHGRSDEHTSELQSLMRQSSAVLCWYKKPAQHEHNPSHN